MMSRGEVTKQELSNEGGGEGVRDDALEGKWKGEKNDLKRRKLRGTI